MKIDATLIDKKIRLSTWTECYLHVADVGTKYIIGVVYNGNTDMPVGGADTVFNIEDPFKCEWEPYLDIHDIFEEIK